VVIVGAGIAGAAASTVLGRKGVRVVLIDPQETYPPCFKAEKIEPDQSLLFRKLGLMEGLSPFVRRINQTATGNRGRILWVRSLDQYGTFYEDMVNNVRRQIPANVERKRDRVRTMALGSECSTVTLMGGDTITARLVVLACGTGGSLHAGLGLHKRMIRANHSFALGFNVARDDERPFPFESLTYYGEAFTSRVSYITLFPIGEVMRVNFFVYRSPGEEWVKRFAKEPQLELRRALPKLTRLTGPLHVTSRIVMNAIDLYQVEDPVRPGLVIVGDAYQTACPATGRGVSKILTDVDVLCNDSLPEWLATPGMGADKIACYYEHSRKHECDENALREAEYSRSLVTDPSLRWRIRRALPRTKRVLSNWVTALRRPLIIMRPRSKDQDGGSMRPAA
jgi:2-polyprenyl-6-methoxyphenol hydroxylase-like FAD-dependent oxidoreductase